METIQGGYSLAFPSGNWFRLGCLRGVKLKGVRCFLWGGVNQGLSELANGVTSVSQVDRPRIRHRRAVVVSMYQSPRQFRNAPGRQRKANRTMDPCSAFLLALTMCQLPISLPELAVSLWMGGKARPSYRLLAFIVVGKTVVQDWCKYEPQAAWQYDANCGACTPALVEVGSKFFFYRGL